MEGRGMGVNKYVSFEVLEVTQSSNHPVTFKKPPVSAAAFLVPTGAAVQQQQQQRANPRLRRVCVCVQKKTRIIGRGLHLGPNQNQKLCKVCGTVVGSF